MKPRVELGYVSELVKQSGAGLWRIKRNGIGLGCVQQDKRSWVRLCKEEGVVSSGGESGKVVLL